MNGGRPDDSLAMKPGNIRMSDPGARQPQVARMLYELEEQVTRLHHALEKVEDSLITVRLIQEKLPFNKSPGGSELAKEPEQLCPLAMTIQDLTRNVSDAVRRVERLDREIEV